VPGQFGDHGNICSKAKDMVTGTRASNKRVPGSTNPFPLINFLRNINLIWAPKEKIKTRN
jgi:hypothetical protein